MTDILIFFDNADVWVQWMKQKRACIRVMRIVFAIFMLFPAFAVADTQPTDTQLIQDSDNVLAPYYVATVRIFGDGIIEAGGKDVYDKEIIYIPESSSPFHVRVKPEYGFHLVSMEFNGEPFASVNSTTHTGNITQDGTLTVVLSRWNSNIPVTFSIEEPFAASVYSKLIEDQQVILCYPHENLEIMVHNSSDTRVVGNFNGVPLNEIEKNVFSVEVNEPGLISIHEYVFTEEPEPKTISRFVRPAP